ncbi:hypothetical protein EWM64_g6038 [Hericium alpestre]|uniref:Uncharacterized protein n=1 Tax=Hericium alpestre TaxID=135208 RepID=A0A4Y9ZWV2_9AGAM|nr:hypothetical protein EWM64_g6038 [Hericium alpestre]
MSVSSQASVAAAIRNRPQARSQFEPDEQWKTETRQRIEGNMKEMVEEAQKARDTALGEAVDEESKSQILKDFEMSMRTIRGLAQEEFNRQLFDEISQRRWASGQQVDLNWSEEAKQEQQRILEQIKKEEGEKSPNPLSESPNIHDQVARAPEPRASHLAAAVQQDHPPSSSSEGGDASAASGSEDESADVDALDNRPYPLPPQPPPPPVPLASHPFTLRQPMPPPPRRMNNFDRRPQPGPPPMRPSDNRHREDDEEDQYGDTEEEEDEEEEEEEEQHPRRQLSRPRMNGPNTHRRSSSSSFTRGAPAEIWRPPPPASQPSGLSRTLQHATSLHTNPRRSSINPRVAAASPA